MTPVLAAHIAFSKCVVMFGKATILVNAQQAGWWHIIANLQVCGNPVPLPVGINVSALWTTVKYGFSWGDLICGYIRVHVDILVQLLLNKAWPFPR